MPNSPLALRGSDDTHQFCEVQAAIIHLLLVSSVSTTSSRKIDAHLKRLRAGRNFLTRNGARRGLLPARYFSAPLTRSVDRRHGVMQRIVLE
jgi:hypothetical protein